MDTLMLQSYTSEALDLLEKLIATPSFSTQENHTASIIEEYLRDKEISTQRIGNNIIALQKINSEKPLIVLNSHHDTVQPSEGWTTDPFDPIIKEDKITGLGSNDAGGSLVSLIETFVHYYSKPSEFQLMLICSAEEEISGEGGLRRVLQELEIKPHLAIVGEPTSAQMAIAEKGLLVIDAQTQGIAGHAAHQIGDNAIYNALSDIQAIRDLTFDKVSDLLGPVKITVTQIESGHQHNVIPDLCNYVIDCRINEYFSHQDVLQSLRSICIATLTPRSMHLRSSSISTSHPIVKAGEKLGKKAFGSPTLSDQVFFDCPSIKIGPGDSSRSHQANEHIYLQEIEDGIQTYISLLSDLKLK